MNFVLVQLEKIDMGHERFVLSISYSFAKFNSDNLMNNVHV